MVASSAKTMASIINIAYKKKQQGLTTGDMVTQLTNMSEKGSNRSLNTNGTSSPLIRSEPGTPETARMLDRKSNGTSCLIEQYKNIDKRIQSAIARVRMLRVSILGK